MRSNTGGYNTPGHRKPPKSYRGPMKGNEYRYRERHAVIVTCDDEPHQKQVYEALRAAGHKCRVVAV